MNFKKKKNRKGNPGSRQSRDIGAEVEIKCLSASSNIIMPGLGKITLKKM